MFWSLLICFDSTIIGDQKNLSVIKTFDNCVISKADVWSPLQSTHHWFARSNQKLIQLISLCSLLWALGYSVMLQHYFEEKMRHLKKFVKSMEVKLRSKMSHWPEHPRRYDINAISAHTIILWVMRQIHCASVWPV